LRQANELLGRDECRELLTDAEMKGVAACENRDGTPAMPLDLTKCVVHGTGPRKTPAADQITREVQMTRAANDQFR
jgi:hypothetical protein